MEYLKSSIKSVLGTPNYEGQLSGAEIVEKLVDRILSSTLLDDRRDACRALKALSKTHRVDVGTRGMDALRQVIFVDETDCEIIGLALDTLCNITSPKIFNEEVDVHVSNHNVGEQFTEIFIKTHTSICQVLKFLEEFDFRVRWSALRLLTNLVINKPRDIQEIVLISTMGVSKLMDVLSDSREIIRNDALLLLIHLTKGNTNIQKIVAFENAFDRIFDVILQEGNIEGGVIVEDCLLLMINLLRGNYSNQNFFKEGSFIQKLAPMLQLSTSCSKDTLLGWNDQKKSNMHCIIQVIRSLVAPCGPIQCITSCQNLMESCGLLRILCETLMVNGVPAEILSEVIKSIAEIIRGNKKNQDYLAQIMAPSSPTRSVIIVLLMSMVNEKQPFFLRCAVLYCFQCFLYKNAELQIKFLYTLLPQNNESSSLTTGSLICGGLFSLEPLSNWFSAVALSHALIEDVNHKEQLLAVLLATNIGTPPVTLMQQCITLLRQSNNIQSNIGIAMLVCTWISYCPLAVERFLSIDTCMPHLMAFLSSNESNDDQYEAILQSVYAFLIAICVHFNNNTVLDYTKEKLCYLIFNRIGIEKFQDMIGGITRHEIYSRSLKQPFTYAKNPEELLLDHEFCRIFKSLEGTVLKSVLDCNKSISSGEKFSLSTSQESSDITKFKSVIREQDSRIQQLNILVDSLQIKNDYFQQEVHKLKHDVNSLTDQNKVLRAAHTNHSADYLQKSTQTSFDFLEQQETSLENKIFILQNTLQEKNKELTYLKKDQEDLLELLTDQERKIGSLTKKIIHFGGKVMPYALRASYNRTFMQDATELLYFLSKEKQDI